MEKLLLHKIRFDAEIVKIQGLLWQKHRRKGNEINIDWELDRGIKDERKKLERGREKERKKR